MSNVTVEIKGQQSVSPAAKEAANSLHDLGTSTKSTAASFTTFAIGAAAAVAAVVKIYQTVDKTITIYAEQERAVKTWNASMAQTGRINSEAAESLRDYAEMIALVTGEDDEAVLSMEAYLAAAGRTEEQIRKIITAAADLSVVDGDLRGNVERLNASYAGVTRGIDRLVPGVKGLSEAEMAAGGVVDMVAKQYAGLSSQLQNLADVSIKNNRNAWDDLFAAIGHAANDVIQPHRDAITGIVGRWTAAIEEANKYRQALKDIQSEDKATQLSGMIGKLRHEVLSVQLNEQSALALRQNKGDAADTRLGVYYKQEAALYKQISDLTKELEALTKAAAPGVVTPGTVGEGKAKASGKEIPIYDLGTIDYTTLYADYMRNVGPAVAKAVGEAVETAALDYSSMYTYYAQGNAPVKPGSMSDLARGRGGMSTAGTGVSASDRARGGGGMSMAGDSPGMTALYRLGQILGPVVDQFTGMLGAFSSVQAILNPVTTILQGVMDILGPLINSILAPIVGILRIVGQVIGSMIAPFLSALGPIIKIVSLAFIWLYNNAIVPFANVLIKIGNFIYNAIASVANAFIKIARKLGADIDYVKKKGSNEGTLERIDENSLAAAGTSTTTTGSSASYTKQRDITVNVTLNTDALVGSDGLREFSLIIGRELRSAGVLGQA